MWRAQIYSARLFVWSLCFVMDMYFGNTVFCMCDFALLLHAVLVDMWLVPLCQLAQSACAMCVGAWVSLLRDRHCG